MDNTARKLETDEGRELLALIDGIMKAGVFTQSDQAQVNQLARIPLGREGGLALGQLTDLIRSGQIRVE